MSSNLLEVEHHDGQFWTFSSPAVSGEGNNFDTAAPQSFAENFEYIHFHGTEDGSIKYEGGNSVAGTPTFSAQE